MVDSNDDGRMEEASQELQKMMQEDELRNACLLLLANKQDLPNALPPAEVAQRFHLDQFSQRKWHVQGTIAGNGEGVYEALDWLSDAVHSRK